MDGWIEVMIMMMEHEEKGIEAKRKRGVVRSVVE